MKDQTDELWEHMNQEHDLLLLDSQLCDIRHICKSRIDWDKLKEAFHNECTTESPGLRSGKKINQSPDMVFNWFKNEINEY